MKRLRSMYLNLGQALVVTALIVPAVSAQIRLPITQAAQGLPLLVTHDFDRIIKFESDAILDAWPSNPLLFMPRFNKGGRVILLQSAASTKEIKVLPQLGRTLGTLTVEMRSGQVLVFIVQYTSQLPKKPILTLFSPDSSPVLRPVLQEYQERAASQRTVARPVRGVVTQEGFKAPTAQPLTNPAPTLPINGEQAGEKP